MSQQIQFAIAGLGHIGKRHAQIITDHPGALLTGVADTDFTLKKVAEENFHADFFHTIDELLSSAAEPDVVIIATPNGLHAEHALKALSRNCHVVIEKPMALARYDCERIISMANQVSRKVFCVMQNRYSPPSVWLKEVVNENRLGKIFVVNVNCYWNRDDRYYQMDKESEKRWKGKKLLDGGPLYTQFSHFIDMMYWLFGDITAIKSRFANFNHQHTTEFLDDSGLITFEFVRGGIGCFNYSTAVWNQNLESSITIIGEKGSIRIGGQYMEKVEFCNIENYTMPELIPSRPPNDYGSYKGSAANHEYVIQNVIDTLTGNPAITTNAQEGMKVVEIIERMYENN
jgi:predicted dehydrogenase